MSEATTYPLSRRIMEMEESATIRMAQLARDLKAKGHDVIDLSLGEPDFDTPVHIKEAAKKALDEGYTKYTPVPGLMELREAIRDKFKRDNGLDYGVNQIVVSNGAKQSIANICLSLLDEGDEVIIFSPYWVSYAEIAKMTGATVVPVYAGIELDYKVTAQQVERAITPRTRLIIFSSPCNPTGSVYSYEELTSIAEIVAKYEHLYVVADEIYEYINFTDKHVSFGTIPQVKDRTITVNGFSKGFAMTGWRLGYIGAPAWIAAASTKMQGQFTSGAASFSQKAAAYALRADMTPSWEMREVYRHRRDLVIELLEQIPGIKVNHPQGAFYIFPDVSGLFGKSDGQMTIHNPDDLSEYLLHTAHVATVSGAAFGADHCLRFSYAASDENLRKAIGRIAEAVARLRG
ncbi:MAG: pyridoxal phosphate-dependent aminotransferase [Saprospiraceae bacterium]|nr:pyridoxal phosphate-dependent aminotransferase [Saprospiraceae bacterium]